MKKSIFLLLLFSMLLLSGCHVTSEKEREGGGGEITDPVNPQPSWFGATAWHPNGQWIVYTETFDTGRLWLMRPDGSGKQQLTFNKKTSMI